jgi:hypothetical protein
MKQRFRLQVLLCCLGSLLSSSAAWGQQDPRVVVVRPLTAAKASGARTSPDLAQRVPSTPKRYWADYAGKAIRRSNLDGSNVETLASSVEGPYGTSYDPETGYVLWTSSGDELVQMAPANGVSGTTTILNSSFEEHFAIVVAPSGATGSDSNVAYGVVNGQVVRITQNRNTGSEQREVLLTLSSPEQVHGLALTPDNSALYLGDAAGRMTQKLNLTTRQLTPLVYDNGEPLPAAAAPAPASKSQPSSQEKTR